MGCVEICQVAECNRRVGALSKFVDYTVMAYGHGGSEFGGRGFVELWRTKVAEKRKSALQHHFRSGMMSARKEVKR